MLGIALLNIFNSYNFKNIIINYISSLSLLVYLIHENLLFRTYIRPLFYPWISQYVNNLFTQVFLLIVLLFFGSILLAFVYKETVQKITKILTKIMINLGSKIYLKIENLLLKVN